MQQFNNLTIQHFNNSNLRQFNNQQLKNLAIQQFKNPTIQQFNHSTNLQFIPTKNSSIGPKKLVLCGLSLAQLSPLLFLIFFCFWGSFWVFAKLSTIQLSWDGLHYQVICLFSCFVANDPAFCVISNKITQKLIVSQQKFICFGLILFILILASARLKKNKRPFLYSESF